MKLTKRELFLLVGLLLIALVFGGYQFVYSPVSARLKVLNAELTKVTSEADAIRLVIVTMPLFQERHDKAIAAIGPLSKPFLPALDSSTLLLFTRQTLLDSGLAVSEYTIDEIISESPTIPEDKTTALLYELQKLAEAYRKATAPPATTPPAPTPAPDATGNLKTDSNLEVLTFQVALNGTYDQLKTFLSSLESQNRTIQIDDLVLTSTGPATLSINLTLRFYGIEKLVEQQDSFSTWTLPALTPAPIPFP